MASMEKLVQKGKSGRRYLLADVWRWAAGRRWSRAAAVLALAWLLVFSPLPWPVTPVMGATFTVNTTADTTDAIPGDGTCDDSSGNCSLRAAIQEANALAGADTIVLQSGATYTLTLDATAADEDTAAEDDLDIAGGMAGALTIQGNGATIQRSTAVTCDLDGSDEAGEFRIFEVLTGGNLTLQNVTVKQGCADAGSFPDNVGGGIFVDAGGTLNVTGSTISGNQAGFGGGILNNNNGALTVVNSTFSGNSATFGGGIFNLGALTVTNSTFSGNGNSATDGGGIANDGTVNITNSTFSGNSAFGGAGIRNAGTLIVTGSTFSSNSASSTGGGIRNFGSGIVTITNSTFSGNSAAFNGGGLFNTGIMTVTNSTLAGNTAIQGGGIRNPSGTLTISNSTLSGNSASEGGGIWNNGTVNASFVTIANNSAGTSGQGGGVFNDAGATFNIKNSIVGNNTAAGGGPNCAGDPVTASGTNLDTDGSSAGFTTVPSTGAGGLNLGPLAVNAPGTTATHALLAGSAAVDFAADCVFLPSPGGGAGFDQRGVNRPQGTLCDVGAYEARGGGVSLDGGGHCLFVDTDSATYQLIRSGGQVFTGQLVSRLSGNLLSFQNRRGEPRLLKGTINFGSGRGSAAMVIPISLGGGRVVISDPNILVNPTCP